MNYPGRSNPGSPIYRGAFIPVFLFLGFLILLSSRMATANEPLRQVIERFSVTEQLLMLQAVCDSETPSVLDGEAYCRHCPGYTSAARTASDFIPERVITGSFTRPGVKEALLNMEGCEDKNNLDGGTVLLRQEASTWHRVWYKAGHALEGCIKFITRRGVTGLLCRQSLVVQNTLQGDLMWVEIQDDGLTTVTLAPFVDNIESDPRDLLTVFPYQFVRIDFNRDGYPDVRVRFRVTMHRIPDEYSGALEAIERKYRLPKPEILDVIFLFDGNRLTPHNGSKPALERIHRIVGK